ncbi:MAG: endonuclease I [Anaerolineales bacterium]|nr:endonuclease I [Anaerolineales bacterium]
MVIADTPPLPDAPEQAPPAPESDGRVVWEIPLHLTIQIGTPSSASTATTVTVAAPAPVPTPAEPVPDDSALNAALADADAASTREYYNAELDAQAHTAYYAGIDVAALAPSDLYQTLHELLERTHNERPRYDPSRHVYPWIDLHPDGKLRSIYSGDAYDPRDFIREDFRIERERTRLRERLRREFFSLSEASNVRLSNLQLEEALKALENSLPYNCEHVVPQSWYDKAEPMRGDLHHLFACESSCNSFRGNTPYYDFPDYEESIRTRCGKSLREENRFEPEHGKGTVARATLYFLLRYPGKINDSSREYRAERIATLLDWHRRFPVTLYEQHRNTAIFAVQGNRNPLIDFPEWADRIDFLRGLE